jgi:hypothetical protein
MEQAHSTHKARNFAIGFLGWFLIGNLVMLLFRFGFFLMMEGLSFLVPGITVMAVGILLFSRRNWFAYGIAAAVIANTLIVVTLGTMASSLSAEGFLSLLQIGASVPLPMGLVAFRN